MKFGSRQKKHLLIGVMAVMLFLIAGQVHCTTITLSGVVFSDEGVAPLSGQTVQLLIDGVSAGSSVTNSSGNYTITTTVAAGDDYVPLLVYVDNGTVDATTVTVMDPVNYSTTISDLSLYADHLIVRDDNQGQTNNSDMNAAKGSANDVDILYSVLGSDLTVTGTNTELYIAGGHSYTPGGNVTASHMQIEGVLTGGNNTFTVSGNWEHTNGTFNHDTSTVVFTGSGTISVNVPLWWGAGKRFYNIVAAASGQTTTILAGRGIRVQNTLTLGTGTIAGGRVMLGKNGGTPLITSGATLSNSRFKYYSSDSVNVAGTAYPELWLASSSGDVTFTLLGDVVCDHLFISGNDPTTKSILDTANHSIICNQLKVGAPESDRYGKLVLNNSVVTINDRVTILSSDGGGSNEIDAGSATINVGGDWFNSDIFTYGTSRVNFTGTGVIDISNSPLRWWDNTKSFYDVSAAAAGQITDVVVGVNIKNILTLGTGTVVGGQIALSKNGGAPLVTSGAILSNSWFKYSPGNNPVNVASTSYPNLWITSAASNVLTLMGDIDCNILWVTASGGGTAQRETILDTANHSISCDSLRVGYDVWPYRYGKLRLNSSTVNINGDVNIFGSDAGGANDIDAGTAIINVSGNWNNKDTFTAGTSTVNLNGNSQLLSGSTSFHNLNKTVTMADTLFFAAGSTQTVTGTATLSGIAGELLRLRSDIPGTRWNFNLAAGATKAISYVNVQDSDASGSDSSLIDINPGYSIDSGNNVSWFGNANITVVKSSTVISDPVNGTTNPKRIPGAIIEYSILVTNMSGAQASKVTVTDNLSAETARLSFEADGYGASRGIQVTAPNINGGVAQSLTNAFDGDQGDYGATAVNTVTVGGIVLNAGEQATVKFQAVIQ